MLLRSDSAALKPPTPGQGGPIPLHTPVIRTLQDNLLTIRRHLPSTAVTHGNCQQLFNHDCTCRSSSSRLRTEPSATLGERSFQMSLNQRRSVNRFHSFHSDPGRAQTHFFLPHSSLSISPATAIPLSLPLQAQHRHPQPSAAATLRYLSDRQNSRANPAST
jgi:hypothetical protein